MSLLQKLLDLSNVKNFSLSAELHSLRKQLLSLQSTYEMAVSDRDNQIADLKKKLETSTYYYSQNKNAFLDSRTHNDELTDENEKLKEQLSATTSTYYDNAKLRQEKEVVATELKNTQIVFEVVVKNLESQLQAAKEAAIKQDDALHDKEQEVEKLLTEISEVVYAKELLKNTLTSRDTKITELKEQLQSAEDDFDEMAKLHTGLEMAFDNLADDNVALHTQLRKTDSYKTEYKTLSEQYNKLHKVNESLTTKIADLQLEKSIANEKFSTEKDSLIKDLAAEIYERGLCETAIENYKATVAKRDDQLRIANTEIISLKENLQIETEYLRLARLGMRDQDTRYRELTNDHNKLYSEAKQLKTELQTAKLDLAKKDKVIYDAEIKYSHDQTQAIRTISRLQDELVEFKKYKDLAKYFSEDQSRLIDKLKAVRDVVKVLEPISMKFQTVLFDLLDDANVPRT